MAPVRKCALLAPLLTWAGASVAKNCTDNAQCPKGETCCNWDGTNVGYATGECGQMCLQNVAPTTCTSDKDCSNKTCCSWDPSLGKEAAGVCGEVCAIAAFQPPKKKCTADAECPKGDTCCNWDNDKVGHATGECGQTCIESKVPEACQSDKDCSGKVCCSWDASLGKKAAGVCGEVCAIAAFQPPKKCTDNAQCPKGEACCNWNGTEVGYATGECGQTCLQNVAPTTCTSDKDCSGKTCCSWDPSLGKNAAGVCGDVCALAPFQPPTTCKADTDCTEKMPTCCSWDGEQGVHSDGVCGQVCSESYKAPEAEPESTSGSWQGGRVVTLFMALAAVWRSAA